MKLYRYEPIDYPGSAFIVRSGKCAIAPDDNRIYIYFIKNLGRRPWDDLDPHNKLYAFDEELAGLDPLEVIVLETEGI